MKRGVFALTPLGACGSEGCPDDWVRRFWSTLILLTAVAGSMLLDYVEWIKHHPPHLAISVLLHFLFIWAATAFGLFAWGRPVSGEGRAEPTSATAVPLKQ
jgi:hypothetical protein